MAPKAKEVKDKGQEKDEESFFGVSNEDLLTMSVKALNKLVKNLLLSKDETLELKHRRRLLKNREYAARRREEQYMMEQELEKLWGKVNKQEKKLKSVLYELDYARSLLERLDDLY